jgi:nucleoside-diphosphate-sugar epimerase
MDKLNFYHQKRSDGGLRSGIDFNEERMLECYEQGTLPQDSTLLWFVDIRCAAENLPAEPESIRRWFLDRSDLIQSALNQLSDDLSAGIDSGWPIKRVILTGDRVNMAVYCSAIRRLTGREISQVLSDLRNTWPDLIKHLDTYEHSILAHG